MIRIGFEAFLSLFHKLCLEPTVNNIAPRFRKVKETKKLLKESQIEVHIFIPWSEEISIHVLMEFLIIFLPDYFSAYFRKWFVCLANAYYVKHIIWVLFLLIKLSIYTQFNHNTTLLKIYVSHMSSLLQLPGNCNS